jgi:hypothetical protein
MWLFCHSDGRHGGFNNSSTCQINNFQEFLEMLDGAQTSGTDAGKVVIS